MKCSKMAQFATLQKKKIILNVINQVKKMQLAQVHWPSFLLYLFMFYLYICKKERRDIYDKKSTKNE